MRLRLKDLVRLMGGLLWLEFRRLARPDGWEVEVEGGPQGRTRDDGALPVFSWSFSAFRFSTIIYNDKLN